MSNHIHLNDDDFDENTLNGKAKDLKNDFDRLHRMATNTHPVEFTEPKVKGEKITVWKFSNFPATQILREISFDFS